MTGMGEGLRNEKGRERVSMNLSLSQEHKENYSPHAHRQREVK